MKELARIEMPVMRVEKNKTITRMPLGKCKSSSDEPYEFGTTPEGSFYVFHMTDKNKRFLMPMLQALDVIEQIIEAPDQPEPEKKKKSKLITDEASIIKLNPEKR